MKGAAVPQILVLAGTNGAGKSSVAGGALRRSGGKYFNPDEATRRFLRRSPHLSLNEANARAWRLGRRLLYRAIEHRHRFSFETTLGGRTMTGLLLKAANVGLPVRVWYVGLATVELHIERVQARVALGGHAIPEERIRERYDASRQNLIRLLPHLTELMLLDNSDEGDPETGEIPRPVRILHVRRGRIVEVGPVAKVPQWAKPIVLAVLRLYRT